MRQWETFPRCSVVGDFDANGCDDVAVTNASSASQTVTVILACKPSGSDPFSVQKLSLAPNATLPWGIAKGNFTGLGKRDIVVANYYSVFYGLFGADVLLNKGGSGAGWLGFAPVSYKPGGFMRLT